MGTIKPAVADVTGHSLITVTRARVRAYSAHKGKPVTSVIPVTPVVPTPATTVLALDLGTTVRRQRL